jgi:hypothetical protein
VEAAGEEERPAGGRLQHLRPPGLGLRQPVKSVHPETGLCFMHRQDVQKLFSSFVRSDGVKF